METKKPIKRHEKIQPLSREHHHSLLLCWKIRTGLSKNIEPARIKKYTDWFFREYIRPHFEIEEKYIFSVLGENHEMVKRALAEHQNLICLFTTEENQEESLKQIQEQLNAHIRFEERLLFNEVQRVATPAELQKIEAKHTSPHFVENTEDEFWITAKN